MNLLRGRIDSWFKGYAALILRFKWLTLLLLIALTAFMASGMPKLRMDTSNEGFFNADDPKLLAYEAFRDQYGRDDVLIFLLHPKEVFSAEFLTTLKAMHEEVEADLPKLNDLNSLINARKTVGAEGSLIVSDLMEELPQTPEEMAALKAYVMGQEQYRNFLISPDGQYTVMVAEMEAYSSEGTLQAAGFDDTSLAPVTPVERKPLTDQEIQEVVRKAKELQQKYQSADLQIQLAGTPVVTDFLKSSMQKDMPRFILMAVAMIFGFLALTFRRFSGVFLPLLTVILALVYTLGLMGHMGAFIKTPTMILPSFLLAVCVGASVHLMSMFYKDYVQDKGNKEQAILDAMEHSGLPIVMTSLTTAAGLASFANSAVAPIADLGVYASFGVLAGLFMTLTMIPCFLGILPVRSLSKADLEPHERSLDMILMKFGDFGHNHAGKVAIFALVVSVIALMGALRLNFSHNILAWYPDDNEIKLATQAMDQHLGGAVNMEVIIKTNLENGQYNPELQAGLAEFEQNALLTTNLQGQPVVGKTSSLATILKEINRALNENKQEFYTVPKDQETIAQEFLLFENSGSDDLKRVTDSQFTQSRFSAKSQWLDSAEYTHVISQVQAEADRIFAGKAQVEVTGVAALFSETVKIMMSTMVTSYLIAFSLITLMMILLLGDVKIGLLSMIPNLMPILFTLGFMGWMGIPLDMFTLLIGSIAIGLAVDDTIHFFHNFRKYLIKYGTVKAAIDHTLLTAGRAMLITSVVLVLGFWLFMFASLNNLINFGLLTGMTLIVAFLADVILSPALLTLVKGKDATAW